MTETVWNHHRDQLLAQFRGLEENVCQRVMSAFGDIDGKLETYSSELDRRSFESDEPSFQQEECKAELYALFEDELRIAQTDAAAFAVVALYHHWERSLKWMIAREHRPTPVERLEAANFEGLKVRLQFETLPPDCQRAFDDLHLGRLIANVIKHGKGPSADALESKAPELFTCPWDDKQFDLPSDHGVNLIWVQPAHVDAVADAIRRFWETLPADRLPAMPPLTLESMLNGDLD